MDAQKGYKFDDMAVAYFELGNSYYYGNENTEVDTEKALAFYQKAAECGYAPAYEQIGNIYYLSDNIPGAISAFENAVQADRFWCYCNLGIIYGFDEVYKDLYMEKSSWDNFFARAGEMISMTDDPSQFYATLFANIFNYYLIYCDEPRLKEHLPFFRKHKTHLMRFAESMIDITSHQDSVNKYTNFLLFLKRGL